MSAPASPKPKSSSLPKSVLVTVLVISAITFAVVRGCQRSDPNAIPEIPVLRSSFDYNQTLDQVEKLTAAGLERSANDEPLTEADKLAMRQAEPLIKGLIAYDYRRFTHFLLLAKLYYANEKYLEALWACNELFQKAPPQGTQDVIAAVAEARYVASRSYYFERQYLEAAAEGKEAVRRMPRSAEYMWAEASARVQLKETKEAKLLLETALVLDPNHKKSQQLLDFISTPAKASQP